MVLGMKKLYLGGAALLAMLSCAKAGVEEDSASNGAGNGNGSDNGGRGGAPGGRMGGNANIGGLPDMLGIDPDFMGCDTTVVDPRPTTPTVALVVDRSSSMTDNLYGTETRWQALKTVILDPASGIIKPNEKTVRFGLLTYTSTAMDATCPVLGKVELAFGNYDAINTLYGPMETPSIKAETPTAEGLRAAVKMLEDFKEDGAKTIVLATDGEPDGCPGTCTVNCPVHLTPGYPRDPNCGHDEVIQAVQDAFKKGIKTYVIAIGNEVGQDHLQAVANAGQGLGPVLGDKANWLQYSCRIPPEQMKGQYVPMAASNAVAYRPENRDALTAAFKSIVDNVRGCTVDLMGEVKDPARAQSAVVLLEGQPLAYNDPNGWRLRSATEAELLGTACDKFQKLTGATDRDKNRKLLVITFTDCRVFNPE
jgi:hypothetical protein